MLGIFGKQSELSLEGWMENFVLPCKAVSGVYIYISMFLPDFHVLQYT